MKKMTLFVAFTLICLSGFTQSDSFSLVLELVKPNKIVDEKAYFKAVLTNETTDAIYLIPSSADASAGMSSNRTSFLVPELKMKDGSVEQGMEQGFFYVEWHDGMRNLTLSPGDSYTCYISIDYFNGYMGMLPYGSMNQTAQVRIMVKKFSAFRVKGGEPGGIELTLYSNWLDVSSEDFSQRDKR